MELRNIIFFILEFNLTQLYSKYIDEEFRFVWEISSVFMVLSSLRFKKLFKESLLKPVFLRSSTF